MIEFCLKQVTAKLNGQEVDKSKPCMLRLLKKQMKKHGGKAATGVCERCSGEVEMGEFDKNSEKSLTKNTEED